MLKGRVGESLEKWTGLSWTRAVSLDWSSWFVRGRNNEACLAHGGSAKIWRFSHTAGEELTFLRPVVWRPLAEFVPV